MFKSGMKFNECAGDDIKLVLASKENTDIVERHQRAFAKGLAGYTLNHGSLWDCLTEQMEAEGLIPRRR